MAAHSSIPAWGIPRTEEPGGLQLGVAKSQGAHAHTQGGLCQPLAMVWEVRCGSHQPGPLQQVTQLFFAFRLTSEDCCEN